MSRTAGAIRMLQLRAINALCPIAHAVAPSARHLATSAPLRMPPATTRSISSAKPTSSKARRASGIAEQYPAELGELIIPDAEDVTDLASRLVRWRTAADEWREKIRPFSAALREHTWRRMAEQIVAIVEAHRGQSSTVQDSRRAGCAA